MEISMNAKTESPVKDTLKAGVVGGAALGGVQVAKSVAPVLKDGYTNSISRQQSVIDKFVKSGKSVEEYMKGPRNFIEKIKEPGSIVKTHETMSAQKWSDSFVPKYKETVLKGTLQASKDADKMEKLLEKGKPSKLSAIKDALGDFASKVKGKAKDFMGAENKIDFLKNQKALKKAGKFALIGAGIMAGATVIKNALSDKKAE